jgi:excisionase family DNA binding protein
MKGGCNVEDDALLTVEEACRHLGVSRPTLAAFVREYGIPKYKKPFTGRRDFFKRSDLDAAKNAPTPKKVAA